MRPLLGIILLVSSLATLARADDTSAYQVSAAKGPYFLVDPRVVEDRWLVERFVIPPVRFGKNPVLTKAHEWEGTGPHAGGSVLRDPRTGRWQMWYSVFNQDAYTNRRPFSYNVCNAESADGLNWERPFLGVFDFHGSTDNNCIRLGTDKTQNIDVCRNPRPDRWPGKYLAIHNQKGGVFVSWSDDGYSFQRLFEHPAIAYHSDTHNNFIYDESRDRWLLYCRHRAYAGYHKRRVSLQTSADLEHWTHERTILIPTETEIPEYYGMTVFRRGDLFFGIVAIYDNGTGLMHGELAWSDDGEHWDFVPTHPPFLALGATGAWDAGMVLPMESPVELENELRFYYGGFQLNHHTSNNPCGIGLMTSERDRLVGVRPTGKEPGVVMTRPVRTADARLTVNAKVGGSIVAELRTDDNKPLAGFEFADCIPVRSSGYDCPVTWKHAELAQAPVSLARIVFRLEDASIFTFSLQ
ncbi:MAG: hypothetical protein U0992_03680 [Planctomycetaceae bacterium]